MLDNKRLEKIGWLFHAALDLPPELRADFLDSQCGPDAELRSEVASLITAHEQAGEFIEDSASDMAAALLATSPNQPTRIGHYRIEKLVGRGGMGEVYLAVDRIGRRVA